MRRIDPELGCGSIDRFAGPAVEHRILTNGKREATADLFEWGGLVGHDPKLALRSGMRKRTRINATTISIAPTQSSGVKLSR